MKTFRLFMVGVLVCGLTGSLQTSSDLEKDVVAWLKQSTQPGEMSLKHMKKLYSEGQTLTVALACVKGKPSILSSLVSGNGKSARITRLHKLLDTSLSLMATTIRMHESKIMTGLKQFRRSAIGASILTTVSALLYADKEWNEGQYFTTIAEASHKIANESREVLMYLHERLATLQTYLAANASSDASASLDTEAESHKDEPQEIGDTHT